MKIFNNLSAFRAANVMSVQGKALGKQQQKLSTGKKIIQAGDGASEYAISEKMRVMLRSLDQDVANLQKGTTVTQTAGGGLDNIMGILTTMKEKIIDSANDTNTNADRQIIQKEIDQMLDQIDDIAYTTDINGVHPLMDGGQFRAKSGYSTGLGDIQVTNNGGYNIYAKEEPSRFLLSIDGRSFTTKVRVNDGINPPVSVSLHDSTTFVKDVNLFINSDKSVTYKYNDRNISFEIKQSYELMKQIDDVNGNESYNIIYEFKNTSGKDLKYDIAIPCDPILGTMDVPKLNGMEEASALQKRYNAGEIAGGACESLLCNPQIWPTICNGTAVLSGDRIYNQPDYITISDAPINGDWRYLDGSVPMPPTPVTNYHYTPSWLNKSVSAGSSYKVNTIMGVTYPIEEGKTGDLSTKMWIQSGTKSNAGIYVPFCDATTKNLGIEQLDITTREKATKVLSSANKTGAIDIAINRVANFNSRFGAYQNRMEYSLANVTIQHENIQSAESVIRDANMAKEMMEKVKLDILAQSAQFSVVQANQMPGRILALLK